MKYSAGKAVQEFNLLPSDFQGQISRVVEHLKGLTSERAVSQEEILTALSALNPEFRWIAQDIFADWLMEVSAKYLSQLS